MKCLVLLFAAIFVCQTLSAPTTYDERQEGAYNLRADLQNFVILVIPTSSSSGGGSLMDFFTRKLTHKRTVKKKLPVKPEPISEETEHFIESKTAPYHVDISSGENLRRLHPHNTDLLVKNKRVVELVPGQKPNKRRYRFSRAYVISSPKDVELLKKEILKHESKKVTEVSKKEFTKKKSDKVEKVEKLETFDDAEDDLKLIGAMEQCGPGLKRDSYGICRVVP